MTSFIVTPAQTECHLQRFIRCNLDYNIFVVWFCLMETAEYAHFHGNKHTETRMNSIQTSVAHEIYYI